MHFLSYFSGRGLPLPGFSKPFHSPQGNKHLMMIIPHEEGLLQAEAMENWFQACSTDTPFSLELVGTHKEQGFVLRGQSEEHLTLLSKQLEAHYPQAELARIAPVADPLLLHPQEHALVGAFRLTAQNWLPIKTFSGKTLAETKADPLNGLLAAMEAVNPGERIVAQLALVRAPDTWIASDIRKAVEHPLQEERDNLMLQLRTNAQTSHTSGPKILLAVIAFFLCVYGQYWYRHQHWTPLLLTCTLVLIACMGMGIWWMRQRTAPIYDMKAVAEKLKRSAFYAQLRVIVIGREHISQQRLRILLTHIETAYRQYTLASENGVALHSIEYLQAHMKRAQHLPHPECAFPYQHPLQRLFHAGAIGHDVFNSLELSGLFHLPQETTDLPLVRRISVKHLLFPPEVAHAIMTTPAPLPPTLLGYSKQRSHQTMVHLPYSALFSHKFLVGRSRYGKSVLMQRMIEGAMHTTLDETPQPGLFVIDPHHDLLEDVLGLIPPHRINDVLLLDFCDTNYPVGINPLDATMGFTRDQAVSNIMSVLQAIWHDTWGPRMAYFIKSILLLLYTLNMQLVHQQRAKEQYTLLDVNPLLQYQSYAIQILHQLDMSESWHQELLAWWQNVYFALPKQSSFRQEVIMPILTKLGTFNDNEVMRRIIGQPITTAPLHQAITHGKIVLCGLSSRDLDDASVNILGSTLINLLHRSFALQQDLPLVQRRKVFVAIDELQNFSGSMYDKLLSEDAKYGCAMLLTTQNLKRLNQIKDGLLEMILANCENVWVFNVSAADAKLLEEELQQKVTQKHIISQPRLHCYARLAIPGHPLQLTSFSVAPPQSWNTQAHHSTYRTFIRNQNRRRLQSAHLVDQQHEEHLKHFLQIRHFAEKIKREAEAATRKQQQHLAAEEQEAHVQQHHIALRTEEKQSTSHQKQRTSSPEEERQHIPHGQHGQRATSSPQGNESVDSVPEPSIMGEHEYKKRSRNHARRKRARTLQMVDKQPVGAPPPGLGAQEQEDDQEETPFLHEEVQEKEKRYQPVLSSKQNRFTRVYEREGRERE